MITEIDGMTYRVTFQHQNEAKNKSKTERLRYVGHDDTPIASFTHCKIEYGKMIDGEGQFTNSIEGSAVLHPNENFNYMLGRKYAFTKALHNVGSRELRTKLWEAYFKWNPKSKNKIK
jgi:hypothetical protein